MIRFSAALVAVAIGVLIGGIATSKLVLVYVAIAVSAIALVALAIGVLLRREELFGEGQGHAPAQAGASPVLPAQSGESHDQRPNGPVQRPNGPVPPPPAQGAAVGHGAAFGERTPAVSAQPEMSWAAPAAADPWASPAAATAAVPAMWQAPPVPASATASGWGAPAASPGDGGVSGAPNWFNPVEKPAADEDWPTRYSWLDEEPEENSESSNSESSDEKSAAAVTVIAGEPALAGDATVPADVAAPADDESSEDAAEPAAPAAPRLVRDPGPAAETVTETADATQPIAAPEPAASAEVPSEPEPEQEAEPPASEPDGHAPVDGLVIVVRGVPRFHQEDCVLIRFMPAGDTQQMPVAEAQQAGCTPCTACQPEG